MLENLFHLITNQGGGQIGYRQIFSITLDTYSNFQKTSSANGTPCYFPETQHTQPIKIIAICQFFLHIIERKQGPTLNPTPGQAPSTGQI